MNQYVYEGPVMEFERTVASNWKASTYAPSEGKARSNLAYRFKRATHRVPNARITLPGKIILIAPGKENK